jgi:hypothetical protein
MTLQICTQKGATTERLEKTTTQGLLATTRMLSHTADIARLFLNQQKDLNNKLYMGRFVTIRVLRDKSEFTDPSLPLKSLASPYWLLLRVEWKARRLRIVRLSIRTFRSGNARIVVDLGKEAPGSA